MSTTIDVAFTKQFESEVHVAYQRMGTMLRNTVRIKNGIQGKDTTFQKVGKGVAGQKTRHGKVPTMNVEHTNALCTLQDWYAGDWCDKLDELKTNIDERRILAEAGAFALGRKTDDLIITAAETTTNTSVTGGTFNDGLDLTDCTAIMQAFGNADIPDDGNRFAIVGWAQWNHLLQMKEFASQDYVPTSEMPYTRGTQAKRWLSFIWIPMSTTDGGLANDGTSTTCLFYHRSAIGHAIGAEVSSDITWHGDYAAHFINNMMSQGSCLIDNNGVYKIATADVLS
ncbi:MAG: phage capsid protein [Dongiaceae bacterium]